MEKVSRSLLKRIAYLLILSSPLCSCIRNPKITQSERVKDGQFVSATRDNRKSIVLSSNPDSIIIENKSYHIFSHLEKKDEFYIRLMGKSLLEGKVVFTITNSEGTEIYKENFPSSYLIGYGLVGGDTTAKDQEDFIKKRILEFFNKENFYQPAIKNDETFVEDFSNKEVWEDIKADQSAVGFYFLIGEEDGRRIAFSKKTKKVVLYFNCC